MNEFCPTGRNERYGAYEDEIGRFKGMGYIGEGADSPCQGEMSSASETEGVGYSKSPFPYAAFW